MSQKYSGEDVVVKFNSNDISGEGRALEISEAADEIDVTCYGDVDKAYISGKTDRNFSITILDKVNGTAATDAETLLETGTSGTLEWAPEGTASGKRRRFGSAIVLRNRKTFPHDGAVQFAIDGRISGSITKGTY